MSAKCQNVSIIIRYWDPQPMTPGKTILREAAFLNEVDRFDANLFQISPGEANELDPQHRLVFTRSAEQYLRLHIFYVAGYF